MTVAIVVYKGLIPVVGRILTKQECAIKIIKSLLPDKYYWQHIEYNALEKKYTIQGVYKGKIFIINLLYPMLYIKERGTRAVMGIGINASRKMLDKSLIIEYFEYKE